MVEPDKLLLAAEPHVSTIIAIGVDIARDASRSKLIATVEPGDAGVDCDALVGVGWLAHSYYYSRDVLSPDTGNSAVPDISESVEMERLDSERVVDKHITIIEYSGKGIKQQKRQVATCLHIS